MNLSLHAKRRLKERSIPFEVVELVVQEGVTLDQNNNRYILLKDHVTALRSRQRYSRDLLKKAEKCAPVSVVFDGVNVITVFRINKRINRRYKK